MTHGISFFRREILPAVITESSCKTDSFNRVCFQLHNQSCGRVLKRVTSSSTSKGLGKLVGISRKPGMIGLANVKSLIAALLMCEPLTHWEMW
jgi:hypothetical protein